MPCVQIDLRYLEIREAMRDGRTQRIAEVLERTGLLPPPPASAVATPKRSEWEMFAPTPFDTPAHARWASSPCGVVTPRALLGCASGMTERTPQHARHAPSASPRRPQSARHPIGPCAAARPSSAPKRTAWRVEVPSVRSAAAEDAPHAGAAGNSGLVPTPPPPPPVSAADRRGAEHSAAAAAAGSSRLSVWQPKLIPEAPKVRQHYR